MDETTNKIVAANADEDDLRTTSTSADDYDQNTEQLRADIEDTRADLSETINEIQERLSPDHLMGQVKETVREATIGKVERIMETIGEMTEPAREAMGRAGTTIVEGGREIGNRMWR